MSDDDEQQHPQAESPRQQARRERREAGERSARAAHALMQLPEAEVDRLDLDRDLREAVDRARAVSPRVARRREERRLAGVLRDGDLDELEARLASLQAQTRADARQFQRAEAWRARLIDEGAAATEAFLAEHGGLDRTRWAELIAAARRERDRGKPRGARKALFREVMAVLRHEG
jgi:ribosome-associated protein